MEDKSIVFATHNEHKLVEIRAILADLNFKIYGLNDLDFNDEIEETGQTMEENALIKARTIHQLSGKAVFADDSGLEVEALSWRPGVYTARYAGPQRDNNANMNKVLLELEGVSKRTARFKSCIALIWKGEEHLFEGVVNGKIARKKIGNQGFGYDPIFIPFGYETTFAEMGDDIKNQISHRYRALMGLKKLIQQKMSDSI